MLSEWEDLAWFWVFQIALVCVDCELVIQTEHFGLTQEHLGLFLLLKFSELEDAAKALNLNVFGRGRWRVLINFRGKCAILFLSELAISPLLSDARHLGFLLGFQVF